MNFRLNYKDQTVEGKFMVDVSPDPDKEGVIVFADKDSRQINLILSRLDFGSTELNAELKLILTPDALHLENARPGEIKKLVFAAGKTVTVPIYVNQGGTNDVRIGLKIKKFRDGGGQESELGSSQEYSRDFTVMSAASKKNDAGAGPSAPLAAPSVEKNSAPEHSTKKSQENSESGDVAEFNKAMSRSGGDRIDALKAFLKHHKDSPKAREARALLPIERSAKQINDSTWQYSLRYAGSPQIDSIKNESSVRILKNLERRGAEYLLEFVYRRGAAATIFLSDASKETPDFRLDTIFLNSGMSALVTVLRPSGDDYLLELKGGTPPFRINYYSNDERVTRLYNQINQTDTTLRLNVAEMQKNWKNFGKLSLSIVQKKENLSTDVEGEIVVPEPTNPFLYIGAALALALAIFLFSRMRRQAERKAMKAKLDKKAEIEAEKAANSEHFDPILPSPNAEPEATETPAQPAVISAGALKIRPVANVRNTDKKALSEEEFGQRHRDGIYYMFDLRNNWRDTQLTEIYASKKSVLGIDGFLRNQRAMQPEEQEGALPEIGGFLLGKYCFFEGGRQYKVLLEEFVPIVPEEHNVYQLQFSTESLVRELGDMQDEYPELSVVGWFHTHPGHGLFLSKPDLTIHDGFFREPYQFAMEIDTHTENLDTGFFTRTAAGSANNQDARIPGSAWFDWTEVEKVTRRR